MELRHLRYFLAVAENSHFRSAAEELLVSQPTLSQQVKDLEKELGTPLFERVGRRVRLTQAGSLFADYAQRAINVIEEGQAAIDEFDEMLRGRLRVGVVQTVGSYLIPAVIAQFSREFRRVELKVQELSAGEVESGLSVGSLDVGVSFAPGAGSDLDAEKLFDEQLVLVLPRKHRLANRKRISFSDLAEERFTMLGTAYCTRRLVDQSFADAGISMDVAVEMNSIEGILAVVQSGGPPSILPELAVNGRKVAVARLTNPVPRRDVCVLRAGGHVPLRSREKFVEILKQKARSS